MATLVEEPHARVLGAVFAVRGDELEAVLSYLDLREQAGYERRTEDVQLVAGGSTVTALVYLATPANPSWLGPGSARAISEQIMQSRGPSGANRDYVLDLAEALRALGLDDKEEEEEVFEIERLLLSV